MVDLGVTRVPKTGSETHPNIGQGACNAMLCLIAYIGQGGCDAMPCLVAYIGQGACDIMPCLVAVMGINTLHIVYCPLSIIHHRAPVFKRSSEKFFS